MLKRKLDKIQNDERLFGNGKKSKSFFLASLNNPNWIFNHHSPMMLVKSIEITESLPLQREKQVLDDLQGCPFILKCLGEALTTRKNGDQVYNLLLEYGCGGTLENRIKKSNGGNGLLEDEVRFYTRCILLGLDHIHALGYIHRDLNPENVVLVKKNNNVNDDSMECIAKIGDYSSVKDVRRIRKMNTEPYLRGNIKYLAPESMAENIQGPECDIWAVGCIVFEMLTGKCLWDGMKKSEILDILLKVGGMGHGILIKFPGKVSCKARNFLKVCFGCKTMPRWTAEMLLNHPFLVED